MGGVGLGPLSGPWESSGVTPALGDWGAGRGAKVKVREFQIRLAWDILRLPSTALPPEFAPSSWTTQKIGPGVWCLYLAPPRPTHFL